MKIKKLFELIYFSKRNLACVWNALKTFLQKGSVFLWPVYYCNYCNFYFCHTFISSFEKKYVKRSFWKELLLHTVVVWKVKTPHIVSLFAVKIFHTLNFYFSVRRIKVKHLRNVVLPNMHPSLEKCLVAFHEWETVSLRRSALNCHNDNTLRKGQACNSSPQAASWALLMEKVRKKSKLEAGN